MRFLIIRDTAYYMYYRPHLANRAHRPDCNSLSRPCFPLHFIQRDYRCGVSCSVPCSIIKTRHDYHLLQFEVIWVNPLCFYSIPARSASLGADIARECMQSAQCLEQFTYRQPHRRSQLQRSPQHHHSNTKVQNPLTNQFVSNSLT